MSVSFLLFGPSVVAGQDVLGQEIVKTKCVSCHRVEGDPMPRRTKKAPDLIWAGSTYQREWLEKWLQNPNEKLYPLGFDFNMRRKGLHLVLAPSPAKLTSESTQSKTGAQLQEIILKGRPGTAMVGFEGALNATQMAGLLAYLRSLKL